MEISISSIDRDIITDEMIKLANQSSSGEAAYSAQ